MDVSQGHLGALSRCADTAGPNGRHSGLHQVAVLLSFAGLVRNAGGIKCAVPVLSDYGSER